MYMCMYTLQTTTLFNSRMMMRFCLSSFTGGDSLFFFFGPGRAGSSGTTLPAKKKYVLSGPVAFSGTSVKRCIESASIGGQMKTPILVYPTQVWKLQPRRAATECATLVSQTNPRCRCRRRRCRERLVDTVLRSAQSPEITALVYAAVPIPPSPAGPPRKVSSIQPLTGGS